MTRFVVVDLETTGLEPERDRIVECALIDLTEHGHVVEEWSTRIGVTGSAPLGASELHHLDFADLVGAPSFAELLPEICERLRGRVVVGHVLAFDIAFLTAECARAGYALPELSRAGVCTRELAQARLPGVSYGLAACCERAGVELVDAHTALGDARATAGLFGRLALGLDQLAVLEHHAQRLVWANPPRPAQTVGPLPRPGAPIRARTDPHP